MKLLAGSAKVNITPPLSIPYLGYVPRQGKFRGVHDPLFARALVLDNSEMKLAIISADSLGYGNEILGAGRNFTAEVRERISDQAGIDPNNIMLASIHAHSTPETLGITRLSDVPEAVPWLEVLMDQLASAVEMAATMAWCSSRIRAIRSADPRLEMLSATRMPAIMAVFNDARILTKNSFCVVSAIAM